MGCVSSKLREVKNDSSSVNSGHAASQLPQGPEYSMSQSGQEGSFSENHAQRKARHYSEQKRDRNIRKSNGSHCSNPTQHRNPMVDQHPQADTNPPTSQKTTAVSPNTLEGEPKDFAGISGDSTPDGTQNGTKDSTEQILVSMSLLDTEALCNIQSAETVAELPVRNDALAVGKTSQVDNHKT